MGKQYKIRFIFEGFIHSAHVVVHTRADAFAGSEEIMHGGHFALQLPLGKRLAFLGGKSKRLQRADGRHLWFAKTRDHPRQHNKKYKDKHTEKSKVKYVFARHDFYYDAKVLRDNVLHRLRSFRIFR
jgi:hypothetical protein